MQTFNSNIDLYIDLSAELSIISKQLQSYKYGIYYWFIKSDKISQIINYTPNPSNLVHKNINGIDHILTYIGIGPRDSKTKKQFFNNRIINCHLGNKITDSTFRYSLASCLGYDGYKKQVGKNIKYFIKTDDEKELTLFIKNNFTLGIIKNITPWVVENKEIKMYEPPFNIIHNNKGWNLNHFKLLRKNFRNNSN